MNNSIRHHHFIVEYFEHFLCLTLILVNGECLQKGPSAKVASFSPLGSIFVSNRRRSPRSVMDTRVLCLVSMQLSDCSKLSLSQPNMKSGMIGVYHLFTTGICLMSLIIHTTDN